MFANEMHNHLGNLQTERAVASIEGLAGNSAYMADLAHEIATVRARLSGPQVG